MIGQPRKTGHARPHSCEGQCLPISRTSGGDDRKAGHIESSWITMKRKGWMSWSAGQGNVLSKKSLYRSDRGLFWDYSAECSELWRPSTAREASEQTGGPKLFLQTLQALRPTASVQAEGAGVPAGAEGAADIVSGSFCHPESIDATIECTSYAEVLR